MNQLSSILFHVHLESLDFSLAFSFRTQVQSRASRRVLKASSSLEPSK